MSKQQVEKFAGRVSIDNECVRYRQLLQKRTTKKRKGSLSRGQIRKKQSTCDKKTPYVSALLADNEIDRQKGSKNTGRQLYKYVCPHCSYWHLTRKQGSDVV